MYLSLWYLGEQGENEFGPPAGHDAAAGARAGAAGDIEGVMLRRMSESESPEIDPRDGDRHRVHGAGRCDGCGYHSRRSRLIQLLPILNTLVPQVAQVPVVAGRPFFIVIC